MVRGVDINSSPAKTEKANFGSLSAVERRDVLSADRRGRMDSVTAVVKMLSTSATPRRRVLSTSAAPLRNEVRIRSRGMMAKIFEVVSQEF